MKISTSLQQIKPKVYTQGFTVVEVSLQELASTANRKAVSGAEFKNGHRKASNIIRGSNIILIDCDEPGQAEAVESKIQHYDYVKVPSASNLTASYKWHYFVPTQEPLSIYPGAYRFQVQQFFNQVGITDEMVDTTGSYDIARQFAPAQFATAVALSEVNETDLQAPVIKAPEELCNEAVQSITLDIPGLAVTELPANSVWYQGKAITYTEVVKALTGTDNVVVSGFGCPHNNSHSLDNRRGYGFGYVDKNGETVIKCAGTSCKDNPYFTVPTVTTEPTMEIKEIAIVPVSPELYRSTMESHWINNLRQIKADGMDSNWHIFASTMNSIVCDNQDSKRSTAHIIPMATGESKTQGSIVYLSILPAQVKAMMVVRLNVDALSVEEQINNLGGDAVAYNSTVDVEIADAAKYQVVIVSHEFFKRNGYSNNIKWKTLADDRDLFIIDEALHSVNSVTISRREHEFLNYTAKSLKHQWMMDVIDRNINTIDMLKSEELGGFSVLAPLDQSTPYREELIDEMFPNLNEQQKKLITRENISQANLGMIDEFIQLLKSQPLTNAISCRSRYIKQQHLESFYRKEDITLAEDLKTIVSTGAFATKKRESITGVRELVPGGVSFAVLDATAPVNAIYSLQKKYKGNVHTVPVSRTRNYKGFTIKCGRTSTGKGSLNKDSIHQMCNSISGELVPGDKILFVTHKANKVFISRWKEVTTIPDGVEVAIEHYGNITGKNDWRDYNKVALIGLPHKSTEFYQSLNIIKTSEDLAYRDEGKQNHTQIEYTDLASDMVQATARIRVRNIINESGGCLPATAYITLNSRKSLYATLQYSLEQQFPGADIKEWELPTSVSKAEQLPLGYEPTLEYLEDRLTIIGADIDIYEPRDILDINRKSYSRLITNKTFLEQLQHLGFEIQGKQVRDKRGRMKKTPSKFFVRVSEEVTDWD